MSTGQAQQGVIVAGVDLGATHMQVGIVSERGSILARGGSHTHREEGFEGVLDRIAGQIDRLCEEAGVSRADLAAVGVGAAGVIDPGGRGRAGVVRFAVNLGWTDVPLSEALSTRLGVPVALENDVNAAVLAEWQHGAGRGSSNLLGVWLGTGVGGALVLGGRLHYGAYDSAGEIGHAVVFGGERGEHRVLEVLASRPAIVQRLTDRVARGEPSMLVDMTGGDVSRARSADVGRAWAAGDELTGGVVDELVAILAVPLANAVTLLSLDRIVIGGGLGEALGEAFGGRIEEAVRDIAFPDVCRAVRVVTSELRENAGLLGAAARARAIVSA